MSDRTWPRLCLKYLQEDMPSGEGKGDAGYDLLDVVSGGSHIYGQILIPDSVFSGHRPCVILLHGFPGSYRNDDLAQALRRIGCVVLIPHHRGAWGSQGTYLISHCVEDAVNLVQFVRSPDFRERLLIDPDSVFLIGHSMGGNTALNAARQLPELRGIVLLTPYDAARYLLTGREEELKELLREERVLRCDGPEALYADIAAHRDDYSFPGAFPQLKDQNLCIVVGEQDPVAPEHEMVTPLWSLLSAHETAAVQRLHVLPSGHGLCGTRVAMAARVGEFLNDVLNRIPSSSEDSQEEI